MKFEIGDKLVHCPEGVCVVEDIVEIKVEKEKKQYYMLRSVTDHSEVIYVSTKAIQHSVRRLKSREEVEMLLQIQPEEESFLKKNSQQKSNIQKQAILRDDSEKLMKLIKLYTKKKESTKLSLGDNLWLGHAEQYLLTEIAEVLGLQYGEFIHRRLVAAG